MRFRSILKNRDLFVVSALSLRERVARQAPGEGSPSHDFQKSTDGGAGCPHPALAAPPSPDGRRTRPSFSNLFRTALVIDRPYNLRDRDFFREIHVLDRIQQSDAFLHRALERLST